MSHSLHFQFYFGSRETESSPITQNYHTCRMEIEFFLKAATEFACRLVPGSIERKNHPYPAGSILSDGRLLEKNFDEFLEVGKIKRDVTL